MYGEGISGRVAISFRRLPRNITGRLGESTTGVRVRLTLYLKLGLHVSPGSGVIIRSWLMSSGNL
eukprot:1379210-Amorphochlora_amoeboformis.AAC.1